jgi:hypothetical protein
VDGCVGPQKFGEEAAAAEGGTEIIVRLRELQKVMTVMTVPKVRDGSSAGIAHLRAGLGARHEVLLPSARQAILTAGPWVSRPWFEQFLRAVTPLRDQRFHRCSGDHAIG